MPKIDVVEIGWNRKVKGGADKVAWYLFKYLNLDKRIGRVEYWSWKNTKIGSWDGVVHNHTFFSTIADSCKRRNLPHVATVHAIPPERLYRSWQKTTLSKADAIVTINGWLRDYVVKRYKIDADKVTVILNGAPLHKIERATVEDRDYFVVGYHGRITESKGVDKLIEAVKLLRSELDLDVRLRFLGWDYYGIPDEDWIYYDGVALDDRTIAHWIDMIDLEVLPTKDDQQPLTVIEALLRGKPVILTKLPTLKEFDGLVDWLDDPENYYSIAFKILRYVFGEKPNTAKLQKSAIKRFGIERMVKEYADLFSSL